MWTDSQEIEDLFTITIKNFCAVWLAEKSTRRTTKSRFAVETMNGL